MADPFISNHTTDDLEIAGEFLTNWLPFLTRDLCDSCCQTLTGRIKSLHPDSPKKSPSSTERKDGDSFDEDLKSPAIESPCPGQHLRSPTPVEPSSYTQTEPTGWGTDPETDHSHNSPKVRKSWADMAQEEDALALDEGSPEQKEDNKDGSGKKKKVELSRDQREQLRYKNVGRKKDFICLERVNGKIVNILDGLELHTGVFSAVEQKKIVDCVYALQEKGRRSELGERTYTEPQKWMRGKGRVTIQFGCCYNYAMDKEGNPPGILYKTAPDPIPHLFKTIIKRLVRWHVLPNSCIPDSCIVNIYEPGDCIPPHIDSHDFVRPFTTVSFLSECNILFGSRLAVQGAGEFSGSTAIPLPVGSVLVLNGNGADVAKHCVPAVPTKRISITFRKMDESKRPKDFIPEPELQNIQVLSEEPATASSKGSEENNTASSSARRSGGTRSWPYRNEGTPLMRPRQTIVAQSVANKDSTVRRFRDSTRRQYGSNPRPLYRDDYDDDDEDEGSSSHSESNGSGRRVRLDRKQIVITRNIEGENDNHRGSGQVRDIRGPYRPHNTGRR